MTTFSTALKLELIGDGQQSGTWGQTTNKNLGTLLEQAITGVQSIVMTDSNYTMTSLNGVSDESRNAVLVVTGTNSAARQVIAPLVNKLYTVVNNTTGGYDITIGGATGTAVTVPNGFTMLVYCDGANFYNGVTYVSGSSTSLKTTNFTVSQSGSNLLFQYNGATIMTIASNGSLSTTGTLAATGNISTSANITATGTVTAAVVTAGS
jgi:hypothetical protein